CEERGLPVMIHTGTSVFPGARSKYGNPMELDDVAIDFPDLPLVMAHGGRPLYMAEAFFILRRHLHVRLDVSGIPPTRLLEYFPRLPDVADRVVWGTDWPSPGVRDMRQNIDQFLALSLADSHKQAILETNALALFPPTSDTVMVEHDLDVKRGEVVGRRRVGTRSGAVQIVPVSRALPRGAVLSDYIFIAAAVTNAVPGDSLAIPAYSEFGDSIAT